MKKRVKDKLTVVALDQRIGHNERKNASIILARNYIYIDITTIEWTKKELLKIEKNKGVAKLEYLFGFNPLIINNK